MTRSLLECEGARRLQRHRTRCCATLWISYMEQGGNSLVDPWLTFLVVRLVIGEKDTRGAPAVRSLVGPYKDLQPDGRSSAKNQLVPVRQQSEDRAPAGLERSHPREPQECLPIRRRSEVKYGELHRLHQ